MFAGARSGAGVGATGDEVFTMTEGARSGEVRSGTAGAGLAQATASGKSAASNQANGLLEMKRATAHIDALNVASIFNLSVAMGLSGVQRSHRVPVVLLRDKGTASVVEVVA